MLNVNIVVIIFLGEMNIEDKPGPISGLMADFPKYFRWNCQKIKKIEEG